MRRAVLVISIALSGGCRDPGLAQLEDIRDDVCACKTSACAEEAMTRVPQDHVESTPRSQKIARAMLDCLAKLYAGERPETGPDTETGAETGAETSTETGSPPAPTGP